MDDNRTVDSHEVKTEQASSAAEETSHHDQSDKAAVSQKDASTDDAGAAKSGFGSRGHRRAPRRFGGWRGSRWAAGTSSRSARGERPHQQTNLQKSHSVPVHPVKIGDDDNSVSEVQNNASAHNASYAKKTDSREGDEESAEFESVLCSALVCDADDKTVRTVQETEDSLIVRIDRSLSVDDEKEEAPQTQRGGFRDQRFRGQRFRGRGFRVRGGSRGRIAVTDNRSDHQQVDPGVGADGKFSARGSDYSSWSGVPNNSEVEAAEPVGRGASRAARGRWRGSGWRRGGAGRYFRQRYGDRPPVQTFDSRSNDKNSSLSHSDSSSSAKLSDPSVTANQDSYALSGEQSGGATAQTESTALVSSDRTQSNLNTRRSVGGRSLRSAPANNRRTTSRAYIVRRSSAGRQRRVRGAGEAGLAAPQNDAGTNTGRSDVCGETEDWDAEHASVVERTANESPGSRTDVDTAVEAHATSNSADNSEELGAGVDPVNTRSS